MEYIGTDLKYAFSSDGAFSFETMEWDMVFSVGAKTATFRKRNVEGGFTLSCDRENMGVKPMSTGEWVFLINTTFFGAGRLKAVLYAYIPDADFDPNTEFPKLDSIRNEVRRFDIETLIAL